MSHSGVRLRRKAIQTACRRRELDPVVLFKLLLLGYLFGIRNERQLIREVQVNVAYRWFLGLRLTDKVPDASTLSQNRCRCFAGSSIYLHDLSRPIATRKLLTLAAARSVPHEPPAR